MGWDGMSTYGIPEKMTTDNGPPYDSDNMRDYAEEKGFVMDPVSPEDPQCNGFAENFVKFLCKMVHTAVAERKDPKIELYNYLLQYRATPYTTTGKAPSEVLFGRKIQTKLPQVFTKMQGDDIESVRERHDRRKQKQKEHFDRRNRAHEKHVRFNDKVLIKQEKSTMKTPFEPR